MVEKEGCVAGLDVEPIDLSLADKHECPGINDSDYFLAFVCNQYLVGKFSRQWYGWNFDCGWGASGVQFDAPGSNASSWKALWRIVGPDLKDPSKARIVRTVDEDGEIFLGEY